MVFETPDTSLKHHQLISRKSLKDVMALGWDTTQKQEQRDVNYNPNIVKFNAQKPISQ